VLVRAIAPHDALGALARGLDVYAFLIGMLALAEFAKLEGVFDWAASHAVRAAGTSSLRLFAIIYGVGILTTALLSNDATIVVLTPAVIVALRRTDAPALPYLFACAFIANAASFILPISNPSNLLVFGVRCRAWGPGCVGSSSHRSLPLPSPHWGSGCSSVRRCARTTRYVMIRSRIGRRRARSSRWRSPHSS